MALDDIVTWREAGTWSNNPSLPRPSYGNSGQAIVSRGTQLEFTQALQVQPTGEVTFFGPAGQITLSELITMRDKLKGICLEHEDCRASLLAHACKQSTPMSGDPTNILEKQEK